MMSLRGFLIILMILGTISFATHLLENGTDIKYIKELLGHFNIKTTEKYLHVSNHKLATIISPFDELMRSGKIDW